MWLFHHVDADWLQQRDESSRLHQPNMSVLEQRRPIQERYRGAAQQDLPHPRAGTGVVGGRVPRAQGPPQDPRGVRQL